MARTHCSFCIWGLCRWFDLVAFASKQIVEIKSNLTTWYQQKASQFDWLFLCLGLCQPTHFRALCHSCSHGLCALVSRFVQLIWILRKTRSGCGIMAVKRPFWVVTAVNPPGLPLGLNGYCVVVAPKLSVKRMAWMTDAKLPRPALTGSKLAKPSPCATAIGSLIPVMPARNRLGDSKISTMLNRASKRSL